MMQTNNWSHKTRNQRAPLMLTNRGASIRHNVLRLISVVLSSWLSQSDGLAAVGYACR
ncbi:hypothetical protein M407DRAFT_243102 [Tulasnella calospora MUT 4182]|uniref:Uncharacterized protein n=1 Tax=Tulasnella calospora MUT 4182 TaxID=1051891 RepID=A0A0C3QL47_9AGAM|nr:hypothetical protein M407DRAFT_243102 [Tulasnella calospora MUT 4182]